MLLVLECHLLATPLESLFSGCNITKVFSVVSGYVIILMIVLQLSRFSSVCGKLL